MTFQSNGSVPLSVDQPSEPNVTLSGVRSEPLSQVNYLTLPATSPSLVAPSLSLAKSRGAYELKFLVEEVRAREIMDWARNHLAPDPHAGSEAGDGYRVNSLYLDTPKFDVFHRTGFCGRRKYRLRRYDSEPTVWLELKRKRKGRVRKRRVSVAEPDLLRLLTQPDVPAWDGEWFRKRLDRQSLRPVCQVTYQRFVRIGAATDGPIRLTIDGTLRATTAADWHVPSDAIPGESLINGQRIVELKFCETLPTLFRGLIQDYQLQLTSFSKYRTSVEACVPLTRFASEAVPGAVDA
ncbi:MAG: polyphosphate polymerase domain-containing protein [Planctomycetales bacterium]|nr:polyphosphate polymerase domain-containing protein [Planctomycetales bacterium]